MSFELSLDLFADFHQFLVRDENADWSDLAALWTEEAVDAMFVQGAGYVAVGTARDVKVPVSVRVLEVEPPSEAERADRIVFGSLAVPTGTLVVSGITDNELSGGRMTVDPGRYRLRITFSGLDSVSPDGLSGHDRYDIELWPERALDR